MLSSHSLFSFSYGPVIVKLVYTLLAKKLCDSRFLCQNLHLIHYHFKTDRVMSLYFSRVSNGMLAIIVGILVKISESYHVF